jgi:hypothetical protein
MRTIPRNHARYLYEDFWSLMTRLNTASFVGENKRTLVSFSLINLGDFLEGKSKNYCCSRSG